MNNLWWKEISGARRIIDSIIKAVENDKNVILKFSAVTPWAMMIFVLFFRKR